MVPNGWDSKKLKDISIGKLNNGIFNDPKLVGSGYKLINVVDIYEPREVNVSKLRKLNASEKDFTKFRVKYGDLFFTRSSLKLAGIAHCTRYRSEDTDVMWECHIMRCTPDKSLMESDFLYEFCHSFEAKKHFMCHAKTGTMTTIDQAGIGGLVVPIPPLPEQQKIAKILSTWDKAISTTEKLIETSKQQKKSLMQQLLTGKKRLLNPETGKAFEGDWEEVKLNTIAKVSIGLVTTMTKHYVPDGVPLIRNSDIKQNKIRKEKLIFLSESFASESEHRKFQLNDLATVHTGEVGVSAVIDDEMVGSIGFATLNTRPDTDHVFPVFLSWYFNSDYFINWCVSMSTGDGRQNLNLKDFVKAIVPLPKLNEQQKIASVLNAADKEIELLGFKLAHLKQEKKALMQQLLTGKRRVKVESDVA